MGQVAWHLAQTLAAPTASPLLDTGKETKKTH